MRKQLHKIALPGCGSDTSGNYTESLSQKKSTIISATTTRIVHDDCLLVGCMCSVLQVCARYDVVSGYFVEVGKERDSIMTRLSVYADRLQG